MGSAEKFCLRWNDFESNISVAFRELREEKDFFEICAGETLALKECVDANNDYYGFLDEIEKERQAEDAATA